MLERFAAVGERFDDVEGRITRLDEFARDSARELSHVQILNSVQAATNVRGAQEDILRRIAALEDKIARL